jgi:hypothetical protein
VIFGTIYGNGKEEQKQVLEFISKKIEEFKQIKLNIVNKKN